jgi:predicted O-methyltransferase YrrM
MKLNIQFVEISTTDARRARSWRDRALRHPFFAWSGLRPPIAQHTAAEHAALEKHVRQRHNVLEIGVAEGASAIALRQAMNQDGTLYLVDPFHLSRVRPLNFTRRAAKRAVGNGPGARTIWIEAYSHVASRTWKLSIDFLLIDGDHREESVERDWNDWSTFVVGNGIVAFHDARLFSGGWTSESYGPVRFVDRAFRNNPSSQWIILDEVDSLVFVRRRGSMGA